MNDQPEERAVLIESEIKPDISRRYLPFQVLWPLLVGTLIGVGLRLVFSADPGEPYSTMMGSFILFAPLAVGAVTVYVAERRKRRTVGYYFFAPLFANVLFVLGTLAINVEGWICAIVIVPLFALIGALGGLLMGAICRLSNWPKHATYCFAALPILLGAVESNMRPPDSFGQLQRTVVIDASPAQVWQQVLHAEHIRAEEVDRGWMYRIGVPLPKAGVIENTPEGRVRRITMGKGIHFDQVVTDWRPERYVHFNYRFAADSFPPRALDDHVRIGGTYFDLIDTSYALAPQGESTALTIHMSYRLTTRFNWYANPLAQWLIGDFEETILEFYRHRSEAAPNRAL